MEVINPIAFWKLVDSLVNNKSFVNVGKMFNYYLFSFMMAVVLHNAFVQKKREKIISS